MTEPRLNILRLFIVSGTVKTVPYNDIVKRLEAGSDRVKINKTLFPLPSKLPIDLVFSRNTDVTILSNDKYAT